jgi:hypothetical protein
MLRSFSYVQHSALRSVAHDEAEAAKLGTPGAQSWESEVRAAFLSSYDALARPAMLYASALRRAVDCWHCSNWKRRCTNCAMSLGNRPANGSAFRYRASWNAPLIDSI